MRRHRFDWGLRDHPAVAVISDSALRNLVGAVRKIEQAMGDGKKYVLDSEVTIAKKLRSHLKWEASR